MRLRNKPYEPRPNPYSFLRIESLKKTWLPFVPWLAPESFAEGNFTAAAAAGSY
jgi:hypothetical protein